RERERPGRRGTSSPARPSERSRRTQRSSGKVTLVSSLRRVGVRARRTRGRPRTGGAFGLSSTRRAAVLAMVVCALALSVAVPLRTYLSQRSEVAEAERRLEELRTERDELAARLDELADDQQVEAEARRRLGYVRPGETPYIVQLPPGQEPSEREDEEDDDQDQAWYSRLWNSITGDG
uniref:FtsB family cell division protein n=1 Tax=Actinoalloteichus spitiensis TaxID=252394 RepID=UPI000365D568